MLAIVAFITAMVLDSCLEGVLARGVPQAGAVQHRLNQQAMQ